VSCADSRSDHKDSSSAALKMRSLKLWDSLFLLFCYQSWKDWFKVSSYTSGTEDSKGWMYISFLLDSLGLIPAQWRMAGTVAMGDAAVHHSHV